MPSPQPQHTVPPVGGLADLEGLGGLIVDAFDRLPTANDRQDMLSAELHHRVQNTLAIVLALARLTARSVKTIDEFQVAFGERVQAMARTNALLLRGNIQAIDVRAALEVELEPYAGGGGQVTLHCEPLKITADSALSLSLLIHELATNAAKYGGLSTPAGTLVVRAKRGPDGGTLSWRETSPGMILHDHIAGSGSVLIRRLARDLGGKATLNFLPTGLDAEVTFKLDETQQVE
jgi:two-component sensor histidine kinase